MIKKDLKYCLKKVASSIGMLRGYNLVLAIFAFYLSISENNLAANAQFFQNITEKIENNVPRLSYGVAVNAQSFAARNPKVVDAFATAQRRPASRSL